VDKDLLLNVGKTLSQKIRTGLLTSNVSGLIPPQYKASRRAALRRSMKSTQAKKSPETGFNNAGETYCTLVPSVARAWSVDQYLRRCAVKLKVPGRDDRPWEW